MILYHDDIIEERKVHDSSDELVVRGLSRLQILDDGPSNGNQKASSG